MTIRGAFGSRGHLDQDQDSGLMELSRRTCLVGHACGKGIEFTESFAYLSNLVHDSKLSDQIFSRHFGLATGAMNTASKSICAEELRNVSSNVLILSVLLYGSKTWMLSRALDAFEIPMHQVRLPTDVYTLRPTWGLLLALQGTPNSGSMDTKLIATWMILPIKLSLPKTTLRGGGSLDDPRRRGLGILIRSGDSL